MELINLLRRVGVPKRTYRPHVVLIYVCNQAILEYFRKKSSTTYLLRSRQKRYRIAHKDFLPNNLLVNLERRGDIRLTEVPLEPREQFANKDFHEIPSADVWVFALLNYPALPAIGGGIFEYLVEESNLKATKVLNLTTHIRQVNQQLDEDELPYPIVAKYTGNGLMTSGDSPSIIILEDDAACKAWKTQTNKEKQAEYVFENYRVHWRNRFIEPFLCIERWIYVCGDLTVGFRISTDRIIRQTNSLTSYWRDPRLLENEYRQLRKWMKTSRRPTEFGSMPMSFCYSGDSSFWDVRYDAANRLAGMNRVDICSMDVIEDAERKLHIVDYNEHTWESAGEDLMFLWSQVLWRGIRINGE